VQARRHAARIRLHHKQNWTDARQEATAALNASDRTAVAPRGGAIPVTHAPAGCARILGQLKRSPVDAAKIDKTKGGRDHAGETMRAETAVNTLLESKMSIPELAARRAVVDPKGVADDAMSALRKLSTHPRATRTQQLPGASLELSFGSGTAGRMSAQPTLVAKSKTIPRARARLRSMHRSPPGPGIVDSSSTTQRSLAQLARATACSLPIRSRAGRRNYFPSTWSTARPRRGTTAHCRGKSRMERRRKR